MVSFAKVFTEIKRRNVLRAAALYIGSIWALAQGIAQLAPIFNLEDWVTRWFIFAGALGLPFWIVFSWFYEFTPEGLKRESELDPQDADAHKRGRQLDKWIIAVLTVAVVLLLTNQFVLHRGETKVEADALHVAEKAVVKSVAVLPLTNESQDADQKFFSDGLSEDLIDRLSSMGGLRVIGKTSSFLFRDSKEDLRSIGEKLGAEYLITGGVQKQAEKVLIRIELIRAKDGSQLWAHKYERPYAELFDIQDELLRQLSRKLETQLLGAQVQANNERPPSGNLEAYALYMKSKYAMNAAGEDDWRSAIADLSRATEIDPNYISAWVALCRSWTSLAALGLSGEEAKQAYGHAKQALDVAMKLDPNRSDAYLQQGWYLENAEVNLFGAKAAYEKALELKPDYSQALFSLGGIDGILGNLDSAIKLSKDAIDDDPLSPNWWNWYAAYLSAAGRLDEAEHAIRKSIELRPTGSAAWAQLAIIQIQRHDPKAALDAAQNEPEGIWRDIALALALQVGADKTKADASLEKLIAEYADIAPYQIAQVYAVRNDADATFTWLNRAHEEEDPGVSIILMDPLVMRFKNDARMVAFCKKIGVAPPSESQTKGI